jgi:hypothetical protein
MNCVKRMAGCLQRLDIPVHVAKMLQICDSQRVNSAAKMRACGMNSRFWQI